MLYLKIIHYNICHFTKIIIQKVIIMSDSTERLGVLLVKLGALNQQQISNILKYQMAHPHIRFGQAAIQLGYITKELLKKYL